VHIAQLSEDQIQRLHKEHQEQFSRSRVGTLGGMVTLRGAIDSLRTPQEQVFPWLYQPTVDERTFPLSQRLRMFRDYHGQGLTVWLARNSVEIIFTKPLYRGIFLLWGLVSAYLYGWDLVFDGAKFRDHAAHPLTKSEVEDVWVSVCLLIGTQFPPANFLPSMCSERSKISWNFPGFGLVSICSVHAVDRYSDQANFVVVLSCLLSAHPRKAVKFLTRAIAVYAIGCSLLHLSKFPFSEIKRNASHTTPA